MNDAYKTRYLWILVLSSLFLGSLGAEENPRQSWTYGGVEYVLPKPMDQVVIPKNTPETYTIVSGDTLWDISAKFLKDPFLWPMIWDLNMEQIPNPHLIFPGQVINMPVVKTDMGKELPTARRAPKSDEQEPKPLLTLSSMMMSGYISPNPPTGPRIIGSEDAVTKLATGNIVYLSIGKNQGVLAGDVYLSYRADRKVYHPITKEEMGYQIVNSALIEIIVTQDTTSTALITKAFSYVNVGDYVQIYEELPVPLYYGTTKIRRYLPPSGKIPGYIVDAFGAASGVQDALVLGTKNVVYLDVGNKNGVLPGDTFLIYKSREKMDAKDYNRFWFEKKKKKLPPICVGELMVFRVNENTSTAVITQSFKPIYLGFHIELRE